MLVSSKLDNIKSKTSEASINNEISHEDFMTIINEEKKYRELTKKALEWWIASEEILKKINLIE